MAPSNGTTPVRTPVAKAIWGTNFCMTPGVPSFLARFFVLVCHPSLRNNFGASLIAALGGFTGGGKEGQLVLVSSVVFWWPSRRFIPAVAGTQGGVSVASEGSESDSKRFDFDELA